MTKEERDKRLSEVMTYIAKRIKEMKNEINKEKVNS